MTPLAPGDWEGQGRGGGRGGPPPTSTCPFPWLETPCARSDSSTSLLLPSSMWADCTMG